jgi:hypothetical protein
MGALRARISRRFYWALIASIVLHFTIAAFVFVRHHVMREGLPEEIVSVTTRLDITRRPPPAQPAAKPVPPRPLPLKPKPQPPSRSLAQPAPPHRELARITRSAPEAQPPPAPVHANTTVAIVSRHPVDFEKTIAQLREQNDPVLSAERPVHPGETTKRYAYDFSASIGSAPHGEGILTPEKTWQADGYDYYYVRYWVQYPDGTTETGVVPWPLRYVPSIDPFRLHILHFPLPAPLADFTLPAGTSLHPLVAYCYAHRDELQSCPIYHD